MYKVSKNIGIFFPPYYTLRLPLRYAILWQQRHAAVEVIVLRPRSYVVGYYYGTRFGDSLANKEVALLQRKSVFMVQSVLITTRLCPTRVLNVVVMAKLRLIQWFSCLRKLRLIKKLEY